MLVYFPIDAVHKKKEGKENQVKQFGFLALVMQTSCDNAQTDFHCIPCDQLSLCCCIKNVFYLLANLSLNFAFKNMIYQNTAKETMPVWA